MSELTTTQEPLSAEIMERVLIGQDLSRLQPAERLLYYKAICESLGLNPMTRPFAYITLNGKLTLYALKDCTEQLRKIHGVGISIIAREKIDDDVFAVTAKATDKHGRPDESIGAVNVKGLVGEAKANAIMKAETKAKRRVTLSVCGLGILDETEASSIPGARTMEEIDAELAAQDEAKYKQLGLDPELSKPLQGDVQTVGKKPAAEKEPEPQPEPKKARGKKADPKSEPAPQPQEEAPENHPVAPKAKDGFSDYVLCQIPLKSLKGRAISDLTDDELENVYSSWVQRHAEKFKEPGNELKALEAKIISKAFNARVAAGK